ncbi:MAG TPA: hypothetical protein VES20_20395, partial [Bryobacteraceae bacterium]|nr:hypothetical protein [Bryobacteraceae bacterium]
LRGLHVFCAWLAHDDSRAINSLDTLVQRNGVPQVWHYLIDFGSTLGSASTRANSPRSGHEQFFTWRSAAKEFFTFGVYVPGWSGINYADWPSVGRFSPERFDPRSWTPEYPNPAFDNRLEDDNLWAAEQVMKFTDQEIRAIVATGQYSDAAAEGHVAATLIHRRDAIGRAYLSQPLALTDIQVENGTVRFEDLSVRHGFAKGPHAYRYTWSELDNASGRTSPLPHSSSSVPSSGAAYLLVEISAEGNQSRKVKVYLRRSSPGYRVVGIERDLPYS